MDDYGYLIATFVAMGLVSFAERALPFVASKWLARQGWVKPLGEFLPFAIMVLLVAHGCTEAALSHEGLPLPEIWAVALTLGLQWFVRNPLLSIFSGTALYIVLLNGWLI